MKQQMKHHETRKYASSLDVAALAGVSQSAVSRTFTPGASVSAATRSKVLKAATALDYKPSVIPKIMLGARSRLIAVVLGGLGNPYYAEFLQELAHQMEQRGYMMLVLYVESDYALDSIVAQLATYRVDAVISALAVLSRKVATELSNFKIPIVTFNSDVHTPSILSISADHRRSSVKIARLFLERGAKRPAFLSGPIDSPCSRHRLDGYTRELKRHGIMHVPVLHAESFSYDSGYQTVSSVFQKRSAPDALFCANDLLALGAIDALRYECNYRVPEMCLVAGFDNIPEASWKSYDLTTVSQPPTLLVQTALQAVEEMLATPNKIHAPITIEGTLIERGSTARSTHTRTKQKSVKPSVRLPTDR